MLLGKSNNLYRSTKSMSNFGNTGGKTEKVKHLQPSLDYVARESGFFEVCFMK